MDAEIPPDFINESLKEDEESSVVQNNEPIVGDEEEDVFYDAGEDVTENSSDIAPQDVNYSVASEDLPTDTSDHSEINVPALHVHPKKDVELLTGNLDDVSTEAASSFGGNGSPPRVGALSFYDDDDDEEVTEANSQETVEDDGTDVVDRIPEADAVADDENAAVASDFAAVVADESSSELPPESSDQNYVLQVPVDGHRSSMEIMEEDDSNDGSSRSDGSTTVGTAVANENENVNSKDDEATAAGCCADKEPVDVGVAAPTRAGVEDEEKLYENRIANKNESEVRAATIDENSSNVDVEGASAGAKSHDSDDANPGSGGAVDDEALTMDDESDVDQSLRENLDVALKVVEESSVDPVANVAKVAEDEDADLENETNVVASGRSVATPDAAENILHEFEEDVTQVANGGTEEANVEEEEEEETMPPRGICSCRVVLFRIDVDENVVRRYEANAQVSQPSGTATNGGDAFSTGSDDSDSSFSQSVKTPRKSTAAASAAAKKARAARTKLTSRRSVVSSSDSSRELSSRGPRSARLVLSSPSDDSTVFIVDRPRRKFATVAAASNHSLNSSGTVSSSSSEAEGVPLVQLNRNKNKRKRAAGGAKNSRAAVAAEKSSPKKSAKDARNVKSSPASKKLIAAAAVGLEDDKNEVSQHKTLRCVSLPIITGIIKSLKENTYQELLELMEASMRRREKAASKLEENGGAVGRSRNNRRVKLSSTDSECSATDDDDDGEEYKIYSKLCKSDEGSPKPLSLRSKLNPSPSMRKSVRESRRRQCYAESSDSEIDDAESPPKKVKRAAKDSSVKVVWTTNRNTDCSSPETENSLNGDDKRYSRRRNIHTTTSRIRT